VHPESAADVGFERRLERCPLWRPCVWCLGVGSFFFLRFLVLVHCFWCLVRVLGFGFWVLSLGLVFGF